MKIGSHDWWVFTSGFLWAFACGAVVTMGVLGFFGLYEGLNDRPCPPPKCDNTVPINEYRQIVRSYDNLNADLRECVEYMDEQAYLIEQMHVVRRFMPDSTEAEMHQLCEDCSANCEDALDWCYYYREEACYCLDDFEEGLQ